MARAAAPGQPPLPFGTRAARAPGLGVTPGGRLPGYRARRVRAGPDSPGAAGTAPPAGAQCRPRRPGRTESRAPTGRGGTNGGGDPGPGAQAASDPPLRQAAPPRALRCPPRPQRWWRGAVGPGGARRPARSQPRAPQPQAPVRPRGAQVGVRGTRWPDLCDLRPEVGPRRLPTGWGTRICPPPAGPSQMTLTGLPGGPPGGPPRWSSRWIS